MRRFLAFLLLPLLPLAAGHADESHGCTITEPALHHLQMWNGTVEPGETARTLTSFQGCAMPEGWWLNYWMDGEGLELTVEHEGTSFGPWPMAGTRFIQLPTQGFPVLMVTNPTNESLDYRLYFDHTCDCTGKAIPVSGGGVWFNAPLGPDERIDWKFRFTSVKADAGVTTPEPQNYTVTVARVTPTAAGPEHVQVVTRLYGPEDTCLEGHRFIGCLEVSFDRGTDGTQYLWMRIEHDGGEGHSIQVRSEFKTEEQAPGLPVVATMALLAVVAAGKRYR